MIKTFSDRETKKIYDQEFSKKLPRNIQIVALRKLLLLNNAKSIADLKNPPANHLEKLKGDSQGQYSIRINDQWRICFRWQDADSSIYDVEIVDYH